MVDTLLEIAAIDSLRRHIHPEVWAWMKKRKPPPVLGSGWRRRTTPAIVRYIRGLGDPEITKSYFLLVWSEGYYTCVTSLREMEVTIREDFSGIRMRCHREDLINQLDKVLERLGLSKSHSVSKSTSDNRAVTSSEGGLQQYMELKEVLLKMQMDTPACKPLKLRLFNECADFYRHVQKPHSYVLYLSGVCDPWNFVLLSSAPFYNTDFICFSTPILPFSNCYAALYRCAGFYDADSVHSLLFSSF